MHGDLKVFYFGTPGMDWEVFYWYIKTIEDSVWLATKMESAYIYIYIVLNKFSWNLRTSLKLWLLTFNVQEGKLTTNACECAVAGRSDVWRYLGLAELYRPGDLLGRRANEPHTAHLQPAPGLFLHSSSELWRQMLTTLFCLRPFPWGKFDLKARTLSLAW